MFYEGDQSIHTMLSREFLERAVHLIYCIFQEIRSYDYRSAIHKVVPNVKILDDEPFLVEKVDGKPVLRQPPASHRPNKVPEHLKADWQLVSEGIKAVNIDEEEESSCMPLLSLFSSLDLHFHGQLFYYCKL